MKKIFYTYEEIHRVLADLAARIQNSNIRYDAMIAIGGGGFIPARILRTFLDIPIYTITTAYYDSDYNGQATQKVKKIQWLDQIPIADLAGKNILIVDEVDDTRTTLEFCLQELMREKFQHIDVAVLHQKIKSKKGIIPDGVEIFYGKIVEDVWINYPWDAVDIDAHNRAALD